MSADTDSGGSGPPKVHRCVKCKAPVADVVIATSCEDCGWHFGADGFLIESVDQELLRELRAEADGCLTCGDPTGSARDPFCSTECNEQWFSAYTDAYLR